MKWVLLVVVFQYMSAITSESIPVQSQAICTKLSDKVWKKLYTARPLSTIVVECLEVSK